MYVRSFSYIVPTSLDQASYQADFGHLILLPGTASTVEKLCHILALLDFCLHQMFTKIHTQAITPNQEEISSHPISQWPHLVIYALVPTRPLHWSSGLTTSVFRQAWAARAAIYPLLWILMKWSQVQDVWKKLGTDIHAKFKPSIPVLISRQRSSLWGALNCPFVDFI